MCAQALPRLQHLSLVIRAINATSCNRRQPTGGRSSQTAGPGYSRSGYSRRRSSPPLTQRKGRTCVCVRVCVSDGLAPRGLARKTRHQMQAAQQMSRPAASTARSSTLRLSQRTKKKPRMTSTPHRLYIRLLASSPKPKKRCVIGVTMV